MQTVNNNRRTVLKTLGVAAAGSAAGPTYARAVAPKTVEVPKLISGGEVYEYMTVEEDWYEHTLHAADARDGFSERFRDVSGVFAIGLVRSPETYGGHNGLQIMVQSGRDDIADVLPDRFDDIPVVVREKPDSYGRGSCTNAETYSHIQGGQLVGCKETGSYGTVCCPIYMSGSHYLLHCAHVFWNDCEETSSDLTGRTADIRDLDGTRKDIGTVKYADMNGDFTRIDVYDDFSLGDVIDDNSGFPDIRGKVSKATLDRWVSKSKSERPMLNHMGVNTGLSEGRVKSVNYEHNYTCTNYDDGHGVYTYVDMGDGDSGGPTYWHDGDYAWIVNITTNYYYAYTTGCNGGWIGTDSAGTGAYRLSDYGYTFGDGNDR